MNRRRRCLCCIWFAFAGSAECISNVCIAAALKKLTTIAPDDAAGACDTCYETCDAGPADPECNNITSWCNPNTTSRPWGHCQLCPHQGCSGRGFCTNAGLCICNSGYSGSGCQDSVNSTLYTLFVLLALFVMGFALCFCCWRNWKRAWLKRQEAKRLVLETRDRHLRDAISSVTTVRYTLCFVRFSDLQELGRMIPHEEARERGLLTSLDTYEAVVEFASAQRTLFISHQWLGFSEPDPANHHYSAVLSAAAQLCEAHRLEPSALYIWIDYLCIPQRNPYLQEQSISSLGLYASACKYFIIVAPETKHADTGLLCDAASYQMRGWCRLEQWARLTAGGMNRMYLWYDEGETGSARLEPLSLRPEWCVDSIRVFEGAFTVDDDRKKLVTTVLGLWAMALKQRMAEGLAIVREANHQPEGSASGWRAVLHPSALRRRRPTLKHTLREASGLSEHSGSGSFSSSTPGGLTPGVRTPRGVSTGGASIGGPAPPHFHAGGDPPAESRAAETQDFFFSRLFRQGTHAEGVGGQHGRTISSASTAHTRRRHVVVNTQTEEQIANTQHLLYDLVIADKEKVFPRELFFDYVGALEDHIAMGNSPMTAALDQIVISHQVHYYGEKSSLDPEEAKAVSKLQRAIRRTVRKRQHGHEIAISETIRSEASRSESKGKSRGTR